MPSGIGYTVQVPIRTVDAQDVKDAFKYFYNYPENVDLGLGVLEPNPVTIEKFIETQCTQFILSIYKSYMIEKAELTARQQANVEAAQRAVEVTQWFDQKRLEAYPVNPYDKFPTCTSNLDFDVFAGDSLDITLEATDPDNLPLTFIVSENELFTSILNGNNLTINTNSNKFGNCTIGFKAYNGERYSPLSFHNLNIKSIFPQSQNVMANVSVNTPYDVTLSATDPKSLPLTFQIVTAPTHGTWTLLGNIISYNPEQDFSGQDYMTFTVSNGVVTSPEYEILIEVL